MILKFKDLILALIIPAIFLIVLNQVHAGDASLQNSNIITVSVSKKLRIAFPASSLDVVAKFIHENYLANNDLGLEQARVGEPERVKTKKGKLKKVKLSIYETINYKEFKAYEIEVYPKKKQIKLKLKAFKDLLKIKKLTDDNRGLSTIEFWKKTKLGLLKILEDIEDSLL